MDSLFKLRPGLFGLLSAALALSTMATALSKGPRVNPGPVRSASMAPVEAQEPTAQPEEEETYTWLQYQVDSDLAALETVISNRAAQLLAKGATAQSLNNQLWEVNQGWKPSPDHLVQRLAINRALQTITDGKPAPPAPAPIKPPTLEDYQNALN